MFTTPHQQHRFYVLVCLFLVYLTWGSSFISIKFAIEGFPPFMMCGLRMSIAGALLYGFTWLRGERIRPTRSDLKYAFILAFFMVFIASAVLGKAQETVSSGTAALLVGSTPIWIMLGGWLIYHDAKPSLCQFIGLGTGFGGLAALSIHQGASGQTSTWGLFLMVIVVMGWVIGSLYSKHSPTKTVLSLWRFNGLMMFFGGVQSLVVSIALGEYNGFQLTAVPTSSFIALGFLIVCGSIIAYTCYFWLLLHTRTEVAISYEYVNPVIGVFLGWLLANEPVDATMVMVCCCTVGSVLFVIARKK